MKIDKVINILTAIKGLSEADLRLEVKLYDGESQYISAELSGIEIFEDGSIVLQGIEDHPK
jgi:hypothetical protein